MHSNQNFRQNAFKIRKTFLQILVAKNLVLEKLWCFTEQLLNLAEQDKVMQPTCICSYESKVPSSEVFFRIASNAHHSEMMRVGIKIICGSFLCTNMTKKKSSLYMSGPKCFARSFVVQAWQTAYLKMFLLILIEIFKDYVGRYGEHYCKISLQPNEYEKCYCVL